MWKVKRMNTARIAVLTIAIGAGGIAAYLASGSDNQSAALPPAAQLQTVDILVAKGDIGLSRSDQAPKEKDGTNALIGKTVTPELKPEQAETLARARQSGTLSLALRSIADINMVENMTDDQARRGESINVIRYRVASQRSIQK